MTEQGKAPAAGKTWGDPGTYLILWDCGDDWCSCYQVRLHTRGPKHGVPGFLIKEEDISEFHSQPEPEDWREMRRAFETAIRERKPDFIQEQRWPYDLDAAGLTDEPQVSASKTPEKAVEIPAIPDSKG